jgi:phosphate transport system permease protein
MFQRIKERIIESILTISGFATSIVVLLIVFFLFKEGLGLIGKAPIEDGIIVATGKGNKIQNISAIQIKDVFDTKISNWKELGGKDDTIIVFRIENITNYYPEDSIGKNLENLPRLINNIFLSNPNIIGYFPKKMLLKNFAGNIIHIDKISVLNFLSGTQWFPSAIPINLYGVLPLILGTLWVSLLAILIALPLGLSVAIYLAEIADERIRKVLKPIIELLAGIPSVVFGFFGLVVIVPEIQKLFNLPVGESALAGSILLAIMALPTIITISEDAIRNTPRSMKEASLALGATRWQTIHKIIIPYSSSGITAAAILGMGRAIGETMAVLMVTGNAAVIPHSILEPVRTIPATIAAELGEAQQGGMHYEALFLLGCILFIITLIINLSVEFLSTNRKKRLM